MAGAQVVISDYSNDGAPAASVVGQPRGSQSRGAGLRGNSGETADL